MSYDIKGEVKNNRRTEELRIKIFTGLLLKFAASRQKKGSSVETDDLNDCLPYENLKLLGWIEKPSFSIFKANPAPRLPANSSFSLL
jgi:hypothetical protein